MGNVEPVAEAPPALYQGVDKASVSYRLLSSMGWREGEGLGANKQGITGHIKVKKKFDAQGVGAAEQVNRQRDWTTGMMHFDSILSNLKEVTAKHESSSDSDSDGDQAKAIVIKKLGKPKKDLSAKAVRRQARKTEKAAPVSSSDDSEEEEVSAKKTKAAKAKLATHVGRYHKRENSKRVGGYSAEDLAAILGASAGTAEVSGPREIQAVHEDSDASSAGHVSDADDKASAQPESYADQPKSWWSGLFVRAGRMGSTKHELRSRKVQSSADDAAASEAAAEPKSRVVGFSEQDQENLYTKVQLNAVHGKQGLGRSGAPKKVGGANWCGNKTKIGSDSDDEPTVDDATGRDGDSSSEDEADVAVVVLASKKELADGHVCKEVIRVVPALLPSVPEGGQGKRRKKVGALEVGDTEAGLTGSKGGNGVDVSSQPAVQASSSAEKVKWKKLARNLLKEAPKQKMKVHLLRKRVLEAAGLGKDEDCAEQSGKKLLKKLKSFPELFEVAEKFIRLL